MKHSIENLNIGLSGLLFTQSWMPEGESKAILVLAHGLTEHSGRYLPFVNYFVAHGYEVHALDHEGHGRSEGRRGYIRRFSDFVDALAQFIEVVAKKNPNKKCFLVGHSMGGVISVNYLLRNKQLLSGCILSGAALATDDVISTTQKRILKFLSVVVPKLPLIKLEGGDVSRDPEVVERYLNDPLVFRGRASARLLSEILVAADYGLEHAEEIELPMLLLHGGDDKMANPKGSELFFSRIKSKVKEIKIYKDLYHEIFLEKEKDEIFSDIDSWIKKQL